MRWLQGGKEHDLLSYANQANFLPQINKKSPLKTISGCLELQENDRLTTKWNEARHTEQLIIFSLEKLFGVMPLQGFNE